MKAMSSRKLSRGEISLLAPQHRPDLFAGEEINASKVVAFVDPPMDTILMSEDVAETRGLRGFTDASRHLEKGAAQAEKGKLYYTRRAKVWDSRRDRVEVSISHDGQYATAVCIAPNSPLRDTAMKVLVDDGHGPFKHEPDWDDEGWFDPEAFK